MNTDKVHIIASQIKLSRRGQVLSSNEASLLTERFGSRIANWYIELLQRVPLAGGEFRLTIGDTDPHPIDLVWLTASEMREESEDLLPGNCIAHLGYMPVAGCATGSGDPFFVDFTEHADPPLIQVFHDMVPDNCDALEEHMYRECAPTLSTALMSLNPAD